jgi:hypothetical protein
MASNSSIFELESTVTPSDSVSVAAGTPLNDTDSSTNASESGRPKKKRRRQKTPHPCWKYARKARRGVESERILSGGNWRKVFYCIFPDCEAYSTLSTASAQLHLKSKHNIDLDKPPRVSSTPRQPDIRSVL